MTFTILFFLLNYTLCVKYMVHFMPHSHIDPGWIKNIDEIYDEDAKNIFSSVTEALFEDPDLRFNIADIYYFNRWWNEQFGKRKNKFLTILERGQI
jgi:alpha-mannosidase II